MNKTIMKKLKLTRCIPVLLSSVLLCLPVAASAADHTSVTAADKAKQIASVLVKDYGVTGVQYAILDHGEITLSDSAGVYDQATGQSITPDMMFGIGSTSKMYVTAATMMLADEQKIDIDQPLTKYLPEFRMKDERYRQITPRMLLNHSSGLYGSHYGNSILFDDNDTTNRNQLLTQLQTESLKANPGEYSVYSNDSFQLLELMVEKVSGMPYSTFIQERISKPLNLTSTKSPMDEFDRNRLAKTYFPSLTDQALPVENTNIIGTGGLYSTAEEVVKFAEVLTGQRPDLLSVKATQAMAQPEYRNGLWVPETSNTFNYGLGWDSVQLAPFDRYGLTALSKGGDTLMYHSTLVTIPEQHISMAVTSSGGSSIYNQTFAAEVLLAALQEKGIIDKIIPDPAFDVDKEAAMPESMNQYSGLYGSVEGTQHIKIKDGKLKLPAMMSDMVPAQEYTYAGKKQFLSADGSTIISFDKLENGHTYLKVNTYLNIPGVGTSPMVFFDQQKLGAHPLSSSVQKAWEARDGKTYYSVTEKINSGFYLSLSTLSKTIKLDAAEGYATGTQIQDENNSVNIIQIPVMNGRDVFDLNFYKKNNTEYVKINGQSYINEDAITELFGGSSAVTTIPEGQYTHWYTIGKQAAGKTITVTAPEHGGFIVYDKDDQPVYSSVVNGTSSTVLPEGGMIVFGGQSGDQLKMKLSQK